MTFTLKQKLVAGFAVNCVLAVVGSAWIMVEVHRMRVIEDQINTARIPSALAAVRIGRYISDASFAFRNYLLFGADPFEAAKYENARQAAWDKIWKQYDTLKNLAPDEDRDLLAALDDDLRNGSLKIQQDALADMIGHGEEGKAKALVRMKGGAALAGKVQADTVDLTRRVELRLADDNTALAAAQRSTWLLALTAGLFTAVSGIFIGLYVSKQILRGISKVSDRMREVAQGDLSGETLSHDTRDEIGEMVESLNGMQKHLRTMIQAVYSSSTQVANSAVELSASSESLLQNANAQKSHSEQIVTAMHEMASAISEVSTNAERAAQQAASARQGADEGGQIVNRTATAMQSLSEMSRTTSEQIEGLSRSSDAIGKIILVISEIAEQTNLLALNAAIEAARAGEQGRGFAVVAGEVRRLAERTAGATQEISGMITSIQAEAKQAVDSIKAEIGHVQQSTESAVQAGASITGIIRTSEGVKEMISQIATASHEQTAATEEINRSLAEIAHMIDLSTAGTRDSATASAELSKLAEQMQASVARFRLEQDNRRSPGSGTHAPAAVAPLEWSPAFRS